MQNSKERRRIGFDLDSLLFEEAFVGFARLASEFSRKNLFSDLSLASRSGPGLLVPRIAKLIFSKWTVEILTLLQDQGTVRFYDLYKALGGISTATLSKKLGSLEEKEVIQRLVHHTKPPTVRYALTERGTTLLELSEPLLLYLGYHEALEQRKTLLEASASDPKES